MDINGEKKTLCHRVECRLINVAAIVKLEKSVFSNHHHNYAFSKETSICAKPSEWNFMRNGYLFTFKSTYHKVSISYKRKQLDSGKPSRYHLIKWSELTWAVMRKTEWVPPDRMVCKEHSSTSVIFLRKFSWILNFIKLLNKIPYLNFIMRKNQTSRQKDWDLQKCQPWKSSKGWGLFR